MVLPIPNMHHAKDPRENKEAEEDAPLRVLVFTYLGYMVLILFGHMRDMFGKIFKRAEYDAYRENNVSG